MKNEFNFNGSIKQIGDNNSIINTTGDQLENKTRDGRIEVEKKAKLYEHLSNGNLKTALSESIKIKDDIHTKRQVLQLLGRINKLEEDIILGTINKQDEVFETNQIRNAALLFIEQL